MAQTDIGVPAKSRIPEDIRNSMREIIQRHAGNEVLFVAGLIDGYVNSIIDVAHGTKSMVPVHKAKTGQVFIHNHPSGVILPSNADVSIAAELVGDGIGSWIVDSRVEKLYVITEPYIPKKTVEIDTSSVEHIFGESGVFAATFPSYIPRPGQLSMAKDVSSALNNSGIAVCEAGTGVGKSFAYLVPGLLFAFQNEERIVVSTATINLQEQLLQKDVPTVLKALGLDMKIALAKGRSNYLCLKRLNESIEEEGLLFEQNSDLVYLKKFSEASKDGSRSDLAEPIEEASWLRVNTDADLCTGLKCQFRDDCFVFKARREVAGAQVIIANHHLVFADTSMRMRGFGYDSTAILPASNRLVFDEAHTIPDTATSYFSDTVDRLSILKYLSVLSRTRGKRVFGLLPGLESAGFTRKEIYQPLIEVIKDASLDYDARALVALGERSNLSMKSGEDLSIPPVFDALTKLQDALQNLLAHLAIIMEKCDEDPELEVVSNEVGLIGRRFGSLISSIQNIRKSIDEPQKVVYLERMFSARGDGAVMCISSPLDVSDLLRLALFDPYKSIILTSATLRVGNDFQFLLRRLGLYDLTQEKDRMLLASAHASPFEYKDRVLLGLPNDGPEPSNPQYQAYLENFIFNAISVSQGRALVLFTSYAQLNQTFESLEGRFRELGITLLRQKGKDRTRLLNQFRQDTSSCLFGTDSFWEGVDVPGESLELVILCKLPFRQPDDPLYLARQERIEKSGGNPFMQLSLPDAIIKFRQGFGRLMRRESDFGVILVPDPRIVQKFYGRFFLQSLPETKKISADTKAIMQSMERFYDEKRV